MPISAPPRLHLPTGLTTRGALLFVTGAFLYLSANEDTRFEVGDLLVHPYLIPLGILAVMGGMASLVRVPTQYRAGVLGFTGALALVILPGGFDIGLLAKVAATAATLLVMASAPRTENDVRAAACGMAGAIALVSFQGMVGEAASQTGINPFESVGNKNAFSLYSLPAILVAVHFILERSTPHRTRIFLGVSAVVMAIAIFSTGNRSGWVGCAVIAVALIARRRKVIEIIIVVGLAFTVFFLMSNYGNNEVIDYRLEGGSHAEDSDNFRQTLIEAGIDAGFSSPVFGLSPQAVEQDIGRRTNTADPDGVSVHNLQVWVWASGGIILAGAFLFMLWSMWMRPRTWKGRRLGIEERLALDLLRSMLLLFFVRALFTHEIIFIPGFPIGLGIAMGLVTVRLKGFAPGAELEADDADAPGRPRPRDLLAEARAARGMEPGAGGLGVRSPRVPAGTPA